MTFQQTQRYVFEQRSRQAQRGQNKGGKRSYELVTLTIFRTVYEKSRAPIARFRDAVDKRIRFEFHHIKDISQGGGVMDVDNINPVTPKRHIDIHREK